MKYLSSLLLVFFLQMAAPLLASVPEEPGLYAVIRTNHGDITCRLFFEEAPMTVANFVGLAEGSRPFIDPESGLSQHPYYDGLIFHRVIQGFMIQGGCPVGQGTGGPGYLFWDELSVDLAHDRPGILSMANSGAHTNGSQFFITVEPAGWLDNKHAVFGEVIGGMEVATAISEVEVEETAPPTHRPVEEVVIETVEIVRKGAAAEAFDVHGHSLPEIQRLQPRITADDGIQLHFPRKQYTWEILFSSDDLHSWSESELPFHYEAPTGEPLDVSELAEGKESQFYRLASVEYGYVASALVGQRLNLQALSHEYNFLLDFKDERTEANQGEWLGTGTFNGGDPGGLDYLWYQEPQRGTLLFLLDGFVQINVYLRFTTETSGTFSGTANPSDPEGQFPIFGTFSLEPL